MLMVFYLEDSRLLSLDDVNFLHVLHPCVKTRYHGLLWRRSRIKNDLPYSSLMWEQRLCQNIFQRQSEQGGISYIVWGGIGFPDRATWRQAHGCGFTGTRSSPLILVSLLTLSAGSSAGKAWLDLKWERFLFSPIDRWIPGLGSPDVPVSTAETEELTGRRNLDYSCSFNIHFCSLFAE